MSKPNPKLISFIFGSENREIVIEKEVGTGIWFYTGRKRDCDIKAKEIKEWKCG